MLLVIVISRVYSSSRNRQNHSNPTRPAASQANMSTRGFTTTYSSTSSCSSDGGTVWCCSLQQWVRVLNTSISVQLFVAFCVSSFVVLCVTDLQVFIIVSHPESKCVSQKTSALTPRRLNKTRLWTRGLEPNKINDSPPQRNTKTVESDNNYSDLLF